MTEENTTPTTDSGAAPTTPATSTPANAPAPAPAPTNDQGSELAPKLPNMGTFHKAITGKDRETKAVDRKEPK